MISESTNRVRDLRKRYEGRDGPVDAVSGLDLNAAVGMDFSRLGPNGAGKTTPSRSSKA